MHFTQIKETCLYVKDLQRVLDFYNGLLALPIISYVKEKHVFFQAGTSVLLCFNPENSQNKKSPPAHFAFGKPHIAFEVKAEDYEKTKKEIKEKGIAITDTVRWKSGQESFYFEDPEGNVLEIVPVGIWK